MFQQTVGVQESRLRVGGSLHNHLMRGEHLGGRSVLRSRRLGPKQLDVGMKGRALKTDAESGNDEQTDEEHLAGVCVQEEAEVAQLLLKATTQPQHASIADSFALQQNLT